MALGDEVAEPLGLEQLPQTLNRVEIGRVGRQIDRLEAPKVQGRALVPAGVAHDQELARPLQLDLPIGQIQKDLEALGVGVGELQGEELARARADHAAHVHPDVVAVFGHPRIGPLARETAARPGIAFDAGLVGEPQLDLVIGDPRLQALHKGLTLGLISQSPVRGTGSRGTFCRSSAPCRPLRGAPEDPRAPASPRA